jgi:hypothetical protein
VEPETLSIVGSDSLPKAVAITKRSSIAAVAPAIVALPVTLHSSIRASLKKTADSFEMVQLFRSARCRRRDSDFEWFDHAEASLHFFMKGSRAGFGEPGRYL